MPRLGHYYHDMIDQIDQKTLSDPEDPSSTRPILKFIYESTLNTPKNLSLRSAYVFSMFMSSDKLYNIYQQYDGKDLTLEHKVCLHILDSSNSTPAPKFTSQYINESLMPVLTGLSDNPKIEIICKDYLYFLFNKESSEYDPKELVPLIKLFCKSKNLRALFLKLVKKRGSELKSDFWIKLQSIIIRTKRIPGILQLLAFVLSQNSKDITMQRNINLNLMRAPELMKYISETSPSFCNKIIRYIATSNLITIKILNFGKSLLTSCH